jgi:protein-disulfide isomerase
VNTIDRRTAITAALVFLASAVTISVLADPGGRGRSIPDAGPLGDMALGHEKAPITIGEYASVTCPHCAEFHLTAFPELKRRLIDTGRARFILREFPFDPLAIAGFALARCASDGVGDDAASAPADRTRRYYAMIDTLFQQQKIWVVPQPMKPLLRISEQAGFTEQSFKDCLNNQTVLRGIDDVRRRAEKSGVDATPAFFINGTRMRGVLSIPDLERR